jgi:aminoglycoside phosphotransferase (APT) family kinase protein
MNRSVWATRVLVSESGSTSTHRRLSRQRRRPDRRRAFHGVRPEAPCSPSEYRRKQKNGRQTCVVHDDPNPRNIRMTADRGALIDRDESHVDVPDLDLVLPHNAAGLDGGAHEIAAQASAAWESAVCWDHACAIKRLAKVRPV